MEHTRDYYYDISKWYLVLVGQWPYQKLKESLFFLTFVLILDASAFATQVTKFYLFLIINSFRSMNSFTLFSLLILLLLIFFILEKKN